MRFSDQIKFNNLQLLAVMSFTSLFGFGMGHLFFLFGLSFNLISSAVFVAIAMGLLMIVRKINLKPSKVNILIKLSPMKKFMILAVGGFLGVNLGHLYLNNDFSQHISLLLTDFGAETEVSTFNSQ